MLRVIGHFPHQKNDQSDSISSKAAVYNIIYSYNITENNKKDAKHSEAPREHIHSRTSPVIPDTPAKHHERGMANRPPHAGTLQQPMFIRGHTQTSPNTHGT
jgi:hypothetical protein